MLIKSSRSRLFVPEHVENGERLVHGERRGIMMLSGHARTKPAGIAGGGGGGTWGNLPTGSWTTIEDYAFTDAIPTGSSGQQVGSSNWFTIFNGTNPPTTSGGYTLTDGTAPLDNGAIFREVYLSGYSGGGAPDTLYRTHTAYKEVFMGFYWKPSNPWQNHSGSNINKIMFWFTQTQTGPDIQLYYGGGGTPPHLSCVCENGVGGTPRFTGSTTITLGVWHKLEWHLKYGTSGNSDGTLDLYLDGSSTPEVTASGTMPTPTDTGFVEPHVSPTWGGLNSTKTETDTYDYNHIYMVGR